MKIGGFCPQSAPIYYIIMYRSGRAEKVPMLEDAGGRLKRNNFKKNI